VFRREAEAKGVEVDWQQNPQDCPATASAEAVNDILSNVLLNAIEAADRGGHVRLAVQSANGHCRIEVEDDGPGIPQNLQAKVLQPFFTTKARGTGLGLAIVQRRLEEVGGTLETRSPVRQARGTLFRITLPVADAMSGKQERPR
jgi:two-component system sensor histidine kinase FlrB